MYWPEIYLKLFAFMLSMEAYAHCGRIQVEFLDGLHKPIYKPLNSSSFFQLEGSSQERNAESSEEECGQL